MSSDIVERFTLFIMLFAVTLRNMIELSGAEFDFTEGIVLPKSFGWAREGSVIWTIFNVGRRWTSLQINLTGVAVARHDSADLRASRRLVEACLYHKIQPHPSLCVREIH